MSSADHGSCFLKVMEAESTRPDPEAGDVQWQFDVFFFAVGVSWHFTVKAKDTSPTMEHDDRSSLNLRLKCGKVLFFLRRFGSHILHILCAFAALAF